MKKQKQRPEALLPSELVSRLEHCATLPSPPSVALRVIELGQCPVTGMGDVAEAISVDPVLVAKILRIANSPFYARQRKVENLRQALTLLGLNGTLAVALSFSLVSTLRDAEEKESCLNYPLFWRRALAAALCCQALAHRHLGLMEKEEFFLAGLLQDIGMLALAKIEPEIYREIGHGRNDHLHIQKEERKRLGVDHADIGGWLLQRWGLPPQLYSAAKASHNPKAASIDPAHRQISLCVSVSSTLADLFCQDKEDNGEPPLQKVAKIAREQLDIDNDCLRRILDSVAVDMPEIASAFGIETDDMTTNFVLDQAKDVVMLRNIRNIQAAESIHEANQALEAKALGLEEASKRDDLTGSYARGYFDNVLDEEFRQAKKRHWPLSIAFVDIDNFKYINDTHGHQIGDKILKSAASLLTSKTRKTDTVARYGGDEFVVVMPGTPAEGAGVTCARLVEAFQTASHQTDEGPTTITVSIGVATQGDTEAYNTSDDLLRAADKAVLLAKRQGRNQFVMCDNLVDMVH